MAMLDKGRMLKIAPREEFERIRDGPATGDPATDLIRQFLRGEPEGPLTASANDAAFQETILRAADGAG
jgi:hypothetical protein